MGFGKWLFEKISNYYAQETQDDKRAYLCDFDRICHEVIPGDVLLIEGANRISRYIKRLTHSPWTHASLYIGRLHSIEDPETRERVRQHFQGSPGQQLLVDTIVGKGTRIKPIQFYKGHHIRICRPTGLSYHDTQRVIDFAVKRLGQSYDTRHFMDLGRFVLSNNWFFPRRWRSSLFEPKPDETAKDICSSMIAEAFVSIKFPVLPLVRPAEDTTKEELEFIQRNTKLYTPSDFDYSPYFAIIKYPIVRIGTHGQYDRLPWREDLISHDEGVITPSNPPKGHTHS